MGVMGIILLIMAVSGCTSQDTSNKTVIWDKNISATSGDNVVIDDYVTIPNGTKSVTIEYNNLTAVDVGMGSDSGYFQFSSLNVVGQDGQIATNYGENMIDLKTIDFNSTPISGNLTLDVNGAKSIGIRDSVGKGNIKIIAIQ
jgi:hypothetical protein